MRSITDHLGYSTPGGQGGRRVWPWIPELLEHWFGGRWSIAAVVFVPRLVRSEQSKQVEARSSPAPPTSISQPKTQRTQFKFLRDDYHSCPD